MNLRKINLHEKISCLLFYSYFIENLFAASQGFSKQASFGKYFILMCRFIMCESRQNGGEGGDREKRVGLQQRNLPEKSLLSFSFNFCSSFLF